MSEEIFFDLLKIATRATASATAAPMSSPPAKSCRKTNLQTEASISARHSNIGYAAIRQTFFQFSMALSSEGFS